MPYCSVVGVLPGGRATEAVLSRSRRWRGACTNMPLPQLSARRLLPRRGLAYPAPFAAIASEGLRRCAVATAPSALGHRERFVGAGPLRSRPWLCARTVVRSMLCQHAPASAPCPGDIAFGAVPSRSRFRRGATAIAPSALSHRGHFIATRRLRGVYWRAAGSRGCRRLTARRGGRGRARRVLGRCHPRDGARVP